jgi:hypothetical protein
VFRVYLPTCVYECVFVVLLLLLGYYSAYLFLLPCIPSAGSAGRSVCSKRDLHGARRREDGRSKELHASGHSADNGVVDDRENTSTWKQQEQLSICDCWSRQGTGALGKGWLERYSGSANE